MPMNVNIFRDILLYIGSIPKICKPFLFSFIQFFKQLITSSMKSSLFFKTIIPSGHDAKIVNNLFPMTHKKKNLL